MKWLITALVVLQAPFLFIVFVMAGTDGKKESLISVWLVVIPIAICSLIAVVNAFVRRDWKTLEWAIAAIACAPTLFIFARWLLAEV